MSRYAARILQLRQMSSKGDGMKKTPVAVFGLAGRYVSALYSAAVKKSSLDQVEKDLTLMGAEFKKNPKLNDFLLTPLMKKKVKAEALKDMASKTGMHETTSNFLQVVAENGRLGDLPDIITLFLNVMAAHRKQVVCEAVTAKPLEEGHKKALEDVLKKFVPSDTNIQLKFKVDPALIGGMMVSIGDKYVDMSIATKIKMYTDILTKSV